MAPAPGKVRIQAPTMLPATLQRTAESFFVAPPPAMAEAIVGVVVIGGPRPMPKAKSRVLATVSAAKPSGGPRSMIFRPRVRMMRQPPAYVPSASTVAEVQYVHCGISVVVDW